MMDPFLAQMIAGKEHELMVDSLAQVSEEEGYVRDSQSGRTSRLIANFVKSVSNALASLKRERRSQKQDASRCTPLSDNG